MGKKATALDVNGTPVDLSNLDKILYPAAGFTKAQVIDYYIRISQVLLPHLKDRPLTMKRYPDGVDREHFYEKNVPSHTPEWVETFEVPRNSKNETIRYCLVNNLPTMVWSANLANLEMHALLAKAPKLEQPTMIVFDLDPGAPADVLSCAQVALWLKDLFDPLRLQCFAKSSGSKGIQVYIPLNTRTDYESTRAFAQIVAVVLASKHPDLVVANMSKKLRTGKVFIDWSQNAEHKTTICVYSLRDRERPYVSIPVSWQELEKALKRGDAAFFYLEPEEALKRVDRIGDLFAPLLKLKQKIPPDFPEQLPRLAEKIRPIHTRRKTAPPQSERDLNVYNRKRDFTQTNEPPGSGVTRISSPQISRKDARQDARAATEPMFVIQKHVASHLHYDFRLEMEGVLRSWAVPKGIPATREEKRLAMHVEDHPMEYATFEGIIPKGNYGAGTVMVWDTGTYTVLDSTPAQDYYKGKLHLVLKGKKLQGEWILVKVKKRNEPKETWLLLKGGTNLKPLSAKEDDRSVKTGRTMKRIAEDRDAEWISNRPAQ